MYWCLRKLQRNFRKLDAGLRLGLGGVTCHLKYPVSVTSSPPTPLPAVGEPHRNFQPHRNYQFSIFEAILNALPGYLRKKPHHSPLLPLLILLIPYFPV